MTYRRIGDGLSKFQSHDTGLRKAKPRRRSRREPQWHIACEFCGRQYVGFRKHWRCPWCGVRNAPEDHRASELTVAEHVERRKFTSEEWALAYEREDRAVGAGR